MQFSCPRAICVRPAIDDDAEPCPSLVRHLPQERAHSWPRHRPAAGPADGHADREEPASARRCGCGGLGAASPRGDRVRSAPRSFSIFRCGSVGAVVWAYFDDGPWRRPSGKLRASRALVCGRWGCRGREAAFAAPRRGTSPDAARPWSLHTDSKWCSPSTNQDVAIYDLARTGFTDNRVTTQGSGRWELHPHGQSGALHCCCYITPAATKTGVALTGIENPVSAG